MNIIPIFAGGGTRLPAHLGVLKALSELDITFEHLVGVSGGSIIASLYASGLTHAEIREIALNTNYKKFRGFSLLMLIRHGGLSSGDILSLLHSQILLQLCIDYCRNTSMAVFPTLFA